MKKRIQCFEVAKCNIKILWLLNFPMVILSDLILTCKLSETLRGLTSHSGFILWIFSISSVGENITGNCHYL